MFDTRPIESGATQILDSGLPDQWTSDELEQRLIGLEAVVSKARAEQLRLLRRADIAQLATHDGSRFLQEWTAARLDVTPELAKDLVHAARSITDRLENDLESPLGGRWPPAVWSPPEHPTTSSSPHPGSTW